MSACNHHRDCEAASAAQPGIGHCHDLACEAPCQEACDNCFAPKAQAACKHNLVNGGTFFVCTKCNGDFDDLGNPVLPTMLRSGLAQ